MPIPEHIRFGQLSEEGVWDGYQQSPATGEKRGRLNLQIKSFYEINNLQK